MRDAQAEGACDPWQAGRRAGECGTSIACVIVKCCNLKAARSRCNVAPSPATKLAQK